MERQHADQLLSSISAAIEKKNLKFIFRIIINLILYEHGSGTDLYDEGFELVEFRSFQDGSKGHNGGVSVAPVGVFDVVFDEGQDVRNHVILTAGGQQHQTHASSLTRVPVVVVVVLVLHKSGSQVI